jgi:hypothetical protein
MGGEASVGSLTTTRVLPWSACALLDTGWVVSRSTLSQGVSPDW